MMTKVRVVDVLVYVADRPALLDAVRRFVNAECAEDAWRALQDVEREDK